MKKGAQNTKSTILFSLIIVIILGIGISLIFMFNADKKTDELDIDGGQEDSVITTPPLDGGDTSGIPSPPAIPGEDTQGSGGGSGGGDGGGGDGSDGGTDELSGGGIIQERAVRLLDETICEELEMIYDQIICIGAVIEQKDTNNCEDLQIAELKEQCYGFVALKARDITICDKIDNIDNTDDIFPDSKDFCILGVLKLGDTNVDLCNSITSDTIKDDCIYHMVTTDEDLTISLCEKLINLDLKKNCVRVIAQEKRDTGICSSLTEESLINLCELNSVVPSGSNFRVYELSEPTILDVFDVEETEYGIRYDYDRDVCGLGNKPETFLPIGSLFRLHDPSGLLKDNKFHEYKICIGDNGKFGGTMIWVPTFSLQPIEDDLFELDRFYVVFFTYEYEGEGKYGIISYSEFGNIGSDLSQTFAPDANEPRLFGSSCKGKERNEFGGFVYYGQDIDDKFNEGLCLGIFENPLGNAYFVDYENSKEDIIINLPNGEKHQVKMTKIFA